MTMQSKVFHPEQNAYPGVFLSGTDALWLAGWLKASESERVELASNGADPTRYMVELLSSCYRESA